MYSNLETRRLCMFIRPFDLRCKVYCCTYKCEIFLCNQTCCTFPLPKLPLVHKTYAVRRREQSLVTIVYFANRTIWSLLA